MTLYNENTLSVGRKKWGESWYASSVPSQTPQRIQHPVKQAYIFGDDLGNTIKHGVMAKVGIIAVVQLGVQAELIEMLCKATIHKLYECQNQSTMRL